MAQSTKKIVHISVNDGKVGKYTRFKPKMTVHYADKKVEEKKEDVVEEKKEEKKEEEKTDEDPKE